MSKPREYFVTELPSGCILAHKEERSRDYLSITSAVSSIAVIDKSAYDNLASDYEKCVIKFDACRGMLAYLAELKGLKFSPPDDYKGDWHEYLIEILGGNGNRIE